MTPETCRGPFGHDFSEVAERLAGLSDGRVVFVPNLGNAGDCVIATGTFALFEKIGFRPEIGALAGTYPDAHLIYSGGGNLVAEYHQARRFISRHREICRSFTLLPHSVRANEELLGKLDDRFMLFAREAQSFEHLQRHAPGARSALGHDMAFMNDFAGLDALLGTEFFRPAPPFSARWRQEARSFALWRAKMLRRRLISGAMPKGPTLNAYRTDVESVRSDVPDGNVDLSWRYQYVQDPSPVLAGRIARTLIRALDPYETVRTDRLHVSVPAAMLGKNVEMGDNNYGKLAGVYMHSMRDTFPKARLA